jgi:hypothetical protein
MVDPIVQTKIGRIGKWIRPRAFTGVSYPCWTLRLSCMWTSAGVR